MKSFFAFFFAVVLAGASLAQNQPDNQPQSPPQGWSRQYSSATGVLSQMFFLNSKIGWISAVNGVIGTTNGGDTWVLLTTQEVGGLHFIDANNGVGISGNIVRTTDGGLHWQPIGTHPPIGGQLQAFGLDTFRIYNWADPSFTGSNDGGKTWFTTNSVLTHAQQGAMSFSDSKYGFLCGMQVGWFDPSPPAKGTNGAGFIITTDGGITWQNKYCQIQEDLHAIYALDEKNIYIAGYTNIYYSPDGGNTWKQVFDQGGNTTSMYFFNSARGYLAGGSEKIFFTSDTGKTWITQNSTVESYLYSITFIDTLTGWTCGDKGVILHTIDGGKSFVQQHTYDSLAIQTYPEPVTTPILYFHYKLPASQHVTLMLYDLLGHSAQTVLQNDFEVQGEHTIPATLLQIPNGTYYYMFTSEHYRSSGHITLSR